MSAKQRLKASLKTAISLAYAGQFTEAQELLVNLKNDPDIDVLGHKTALGLPRQLHSAQLKLEKAKKDAVSSLGYQYNLVPPPALLGDFSRVTTTERSAISSANREAIPRTIHQIWIGPDRAPLGTEAWQEHAQAQGYEYCLWREKDLESLDITDLPAYMHMLAKGDYPGAVDVARYVILQQRGGIYLDCDWYPTRNDISFHDVLPMLGLTAMAEPIPRNTGKGGLLLANSMIAAPKGHPVFTRLLASLNEIIALLPNEPAWWTTGPLIFTLMSRGGALTLADADIVAGALPQSTSLSAVKAWCEQSKRDDQGLLLAWKSWVWR